MKVFVPRIERVEGLQQVHGISEELATKRDLIDQIQEFLIRRGDALTALFGILSIMEEDVRQQMLLAETAKSKDDELNQLELNYEDHLGDQTK